MRTLVSGNGVEKSVAGRTLFSKLRFGLSEGERVSLIGPNGVGKSTLLRMIAKQVKADNGAMSWAQGLRIACLEQVPHFTKGSSVLDTLLEKSEHAHEGKTIALAYELISKLGFLDQGYDEYVPVDSLSGGWAKRVALGRELMTEPDLLLLDEPTNHLDVESIEWLEGYLKSLRCATLTVTHDRYFLNHISNVIWELDPRNPEGLLEVRGSYADYCKIRDDLINAQQRREVTLSNTLRREKEWLHREAAARTTKQTARINRAYELMNTVENLEGRNRQRKVDIEFQALEGGPKKLIDSKNISKRYGERQVFKDLDVTIMAGDKLGLLGRNGAGKSTLLRVLLGKEAPDTGTVKLADNLKVAFFEQTRASLDPNLTVLKTLCPEGDYVAFAGTYVHIRTYMDKFLFNDDFARKKVGLLSGGEQARLLIAKLMLQESNLLVLDEPTNDLDLVTLSVLEESLREYPGAVIIVSHDRYFLEQVSTRFLCLEGGEATYVSSLAQWRELREQLAARGLEPVPTAPVMASPSAPATPPPAKQRKLSYKDQRELEMMEKTIQAAEQEVETLSGTVKDPAGYAKLASAQTEVERLYARWKELEDYKNGL